MKKVNIKNVIGVAILLLVGVVYYYEEIKVTSVNIPLKQVVVAKGDIPENIIITDDLVVIEERYSQDIERNEHYTATIGDVVGKRSISPIYAHEPINLNRLIENKDYMEKDTAEFAIQLKDESKALNIKQGSYIDIWLKPTEQGLLKGKVNRVLFSNLKVKEVKNEHFIPTSSSTNSKVPNYLIIDLTKEEIKILLEEERDCNIKVSLHGKGQVFEITKDLVTETEHDEKIQNESPNSETPKTQNQGTPQQ